MHRIWYNMIYHIISYHIIYKIIIISIWYRRNPRGWIKSKSYVTFYALDIEPTVLALSHASGIGFPPYTLLTSSRWTSCSSTLNQGLCNTIMIITADSLPVSRSRYYYFSMECIIAKLHSEWVSTCPSTTDETHSGYFGIKVVVQVVLVVSA